MADLADLLRWKWMWKSRARLLGIAVAAITLGGLLILFAVSWPGPFTKAHGLVICGGVMFVGMGGYQVLQGLFSSAGAFGDHDAFDVNARRKLKQKLRQHERRTNEEAVPLEGELKSQADVPRETHCPMCDDRVVVPAGHPPNGSVQCPKCLERFVPA